MSGPPAPLLRVLAGEALDPPPVWLMRQAGRYLPEYRALRAAKGSFLDLCLDPEAAAEITLQPIRRFGFDAAILFSDILIVPMGLGQQLTFHEGEGPRLTPALADAPLSALRPDRSSYARIHETVRRVRVALGPQVALIGFAGSPFTVATYMVAGEGSRDQAAARLMAYADAGRFQAIIDAIVDDSLPYLAGQAEAGAQALMLFDSWSGVLPPAEFDRWVVAPTARLVAALRARFPALPLIGFPRGAGTRAAVYARETGMTALALDEAADLDAILPLLPPDLPVQGNLDPLALKAGGPALDAALDRLRAAMAGRPHILNLGHGIDRFTPIAHVERLLDRLRGAGARAVA